MKQIENYNILEEIGQGGMSTVFRAQNRQTGQEVAIKVMRDKFSDNSNARERFVQEAQMVLALNHPAIVPVYDYGEVDGRLYIVMQYMAGGSVRELLRAGSLSFEQTLSILAPIVSALDIAHENSIIHRDVKPHNILLDEAGNAYLSDFGIARLLDGESLEQTMTFVGTPEFIAPEQAIEGGLTAQTDIYQLGICTFFLLTGEMPFTGSSLQLIHKHLHNPLPSAEALNHNLPMGCDKVLQVATAKNPQDRFKTADDLFAALSLLSNESTQTEIFTPAWVSTSTEAVSFETTSSEEEVVANVPDMEKRNAVRPLTYASVILLLLMSMFAFNQTNTDTETSNPIGEIASEIEAQIEEIGQDDLATDDVGNTAVTDPIPQSTASETAFTDDTPPPPPPDNNNPPPSNDNGNGNGRNDDNHNGNGGRGRGNNGGGN